MTLEKVPRSPAERDPASRTMLEEYATVLSGEAGSWVRELTGGGPPELGRGGVRAVLWAVDGGPPIGLALWDVVPEVGRRIWLYLVTGHRTAGELGRFLDELDGSSWSEGPIASVLDFIPGVPAEVQEAAFDPRGFFATERIIVRLDADVPIQDVSLVGGPYMRPLEPADEEALVNLLRESYDPLGQEPGARPYYLDPRRDAREAVEDVLTGRRGEWLPWASFGVEAGGSLVGASLVTQLHVPFLTEVAVAPSMRRIGLAYYLVTASVEALRERGAGEPHAVIASLDLRALRLFRRLGFESIGARGVGLWVNRATFASRPAPAPLLLPPSGSAPDGVEGDPPSPSPRPRSEDP